MHDDNANFKVLFLSELFYLVTLREGPACRQAGCSGNPFIFLMAIDKIKDCSEKPDPTFSGGARPKKPQSSSQTFLSFQAKMTFDDPVIF